MILEKMLQGYRSGTLALAEDLAGMSVVWGVV